MHVWVDLTIEPKKGHLESVDFQSRTAIFLKSFVAYFVQKFWTFSLSIPATLPLWEGKHVYMSWNQGMTTVQKWDALHEDLINMKSCQLTYYVYKTKYTYSTWAYIRNSTDYWYNYIASCSSIADGEIVIVSTSGHIWSYLPDDVLCSACWGWREKESLSTLVGLDCMCVCSLASMYRKFPGTLLCITIVYIICIARLSFAYI